MAIKNRSKFQKKNAAPDINMTPLIDVLLVLIIIFMVSAPMMHCGVDVDLPQGQIQGGGNKKKDSVPITLTLDALGHVYVNDEKTEEQNFLETLEKKAPQKTEYLLLKADRMLVYEKIIKLMSMLQSKGYTKLSLQFQTQ